MGGYKKHLCTTILKVWQLTLIWQNKTLLGESWIEKKVLLTLFWWENMISDRSSCYLMVKNQGLKKHLSMSILKVWQLSLILAKQDPLGGSWIEKSFFNPLLMRKHDFWQVQWYLNGQKWGVKKASLYDHFEGLTTDSYLAKQDPLGGGWVEKKAFLTLFWWENMISDMSSGYLNGQKWGVKKSISVWPF